MTDETRQSNGERRLGRRATVGGDSSASADRRLTATETNRSARTVNRPAKSEAAPATAESLIRRGVLDKLSRVFLVVALISLVGLPVSLIAYVRHSPPPPEFVAIAPAPLQTILPTLIPIPTSTPPPTPTPLPPPIALLAGHSGGSDSGAICPDGLREVDITKDVAARAKAILEARGYRVDILAEFDSKMSASRRDYAPLAFLAIHADSCVYYASGYKVARAGNSPIPGTDDRLVRCVKNAYASASGLPFHEGSITIDMTHYHGLNEIDAQSPAAIIELGFMGSDKALLKNKRDVLALGIADGIDTFLKGNACQ